MRKTTSLSFALVVVAMTLHSACDENSAGENLDAGLSDDARDVGTDDARDVGPDGVDDVRSDGADDVRLGDADTEGDSETPANNVLRVHPTNGRYVTDGSGEAIYLTGSHNWGVLIDKDFEYDEFFDYMVDNNQNFLRLWANLDLVWNRAGAYTESAEWRLPTIHPRTGPGAATDGDPKFDLTLFNPEYFDKLRALVEEADDRGIYISIMLFEGWWNADESFRDDAWYGHPYNPLNNIQDLSVTTANVHSMDVPEVVEIQEGYVRHVIDVVNDMDNVLFEISNEDPIGTTQWQLHMMEAVRTYELTKPVQHLVWLTSQSWGTSDDWLWASSADAVSPSTLSFFNDPNEPYIVDPPVTDGSKVVILDTDHFLGTSIPCDWRRMIWKSFMRGYNPILMDPYLYHASWTLEPGIVSAMGYTRTYGAKMNLAAMTPSDVSSHCSTEYCLRNPGQEYLVYQPELGSFNVDLVASDYDYEWFDPGQGIVIETGTLSAVGGSQEFSVPQAISDDSVLYLHH